MTEPGGIPEFARIRLFVDSPLGPGGRVALSPAQGHYLRTVMRQEAGASVRLFNGRDGEWAARLDRLDRKGADAELSEKLRDQDTLADIALYFAPIKKAPMAYLVEKATEMGAARLCPALTARTQIHTVNLERLRANAIEAAEQSYRLSVPEIAAPARLADILDDWPETRGLVFCDEGGALTGRVRPALEGLAAVKGQYSAWGVLIGPEGGFTSAEQTAIRAVPQAVPVSLGPRILRAETACVTALTLVQAVVGDLTQSAG